ncbi:MAG TPA: BON domain-containing protein [Terriglobia bacterium]|nr:BON domain-containing protein [Terriglobia bacterium]
MSSRHIGRIFLICAFSLAVLQPIVLGAGAQSSGAQRPVPERAESRLERAIRRQLVTLPYYSMFDWFTYRISGYDVELDGYAVRPSLKSAAGNVVKGIEGVQKVTNNIKVLPPSTMDDRIRLAEYRAIYRYPGFEKYAIQAIGPIHIIVNSGHVILEGVVDSNSDKDVANIHAKSVSGVFSVTDNLRVQSDGK